MVYCLIITVLLTLLSTPTAFPVGSKNQGFIGHGQYQQKYISMSGKPVAAASKVFLQSAPLSREPAPLKLLILTRSQEPTRRVKVAHKSSVGSALSFPSNTGHVSNIFHEADIGNSNFFGSNYNNEIPHKQSQEDNNHASNYIGEILPSSENYIKQDRSEIKDVFWFGPNHQHQTTETPEKLNEYGLKDLNDDNDGTEHFAKVLSNGINPFLQNGNQQDAHSNKESNYLPRTTSVTHQAVYQRQQPQISNSQRLYSDNSYSMPKKNQNIQRPIGTSHRKNQIQNVYESNSRSIVRSRAQTLIHNHKQALLKLRNTLRNAFQNRNTI